jgi:PIN domain nuclease of toxin-antitoxin system
MAEFLLDTHTLLWFMEQSPQLSGQAFDAIIKPDNRVKVSVASFWEMTIKSSLGKLKLPDPVPGLMQKTAEADLGLLAIAPEHLSVLHGLPLHHRDPFDRLIIAQAQVEGATLISKDQVFGEYEVGLLW